MRLITVYNKYCKNWSINISYVRTYNYVYVKLIHTVNEKTFCWAELSWYP